MIKFTNLKEIYLNENNISEIGNLLDFVGHFKNLEKIDFSENGFDKNDKVIKKIIDKSIDEYSKILQTNKSEKNVDNNKIKTLEVIY